jgi:Dyp-type peroxidase family
MTLPPLEQPLKWTSNDKAVATLLDDLQANILKGHGRDHARHLFLRFDGAKKAAVKAAIHQLSGQLKSARQQLKEAEDFKTSRKDGGTVRCFFLTFAGYKVLGVESQAPADAAFRDGMQKRMSPAPGQAAQDLFAAWEPYLKDGVHAMLLLADADPERLAQERDSLVESLAPAGIAVVGEEIGAQQRNDRGEGVEHFGYVDGRSQPMFLAEDVDREKLLGGGTAMWSPAFPPLQVLVTQGTPPSRVTGSLFVFRKLEQNVLRFKRREEELADELGLSGEDRELAGAMMVGRFEDGTPAVLRKKAGVGGDVPNNFNYADDRDGVKCPLHAHVRKTNPRGSGGFQQTEAQERAHLMARRGITYGDREPGMGDRPEGEVGLLFMSYQTDIANQFEFTQQTWANNPEFPQATAATGQPGIDPIIGEGKVGANQQQCPLHWGDPATGRKATSFAGFVTLKGGEYFFAPVISALRAL